MPEHIKMKLSTLVKYLPACLFALYALLLFFFCLAPVVTLPDFAIGNVYDLLGVETLFRGTVNAVLAFAVIGLIASLLGIALLEMPFFDLARAVRGNAVRIMRFVWKFLPCLFYAIFFLLSCVMFGQVADLNHQSGMAGLIRYSAGACPMLILIFTLLFAIAQAAALVVEFKVLNRVTLIPAETESENN